MDSGSKGFRTRLCEHRSSFIIQAAELSAPSMYINPMNRSMNRITAQEKCNTSGTTCTYLMTSINDGLDDDDTEVSTVQSIDYIARSDHVALLH